MIENAWCVLCTRCITDSSSNNVTLTDVVEQINVPPDAPIPGTAPVQMDFVCLWYRSNPTQPARATARTSLIRPDGTSSPNPVLVTIDLTQFQRLRSIIRIPAIEIISSGFYYFRVELRLDGEDNWRPISRVPLQVVLGVPAAVQ
jgi:hypothetical protein